MRASAIVRSVRRDLAIELVFVLCRAWRAALGRGDVARVARKIAACAAAVVAVSLVAGVILSAPLQRSAGNHPPHGVVGGVHVALPPILRNYPTEQLVPLP
jgi:hypothetical protein